MVMPERLPISLLASPERGAGKGHRAKARGGCGAIDGFERKRHLRPRPMGSCHRVLLSCVGVRPEGRPWNSAR